MELLPDADALTRFFWTSGQDGQLRIQRCADCRHWLHPPNVRCPRCGSDHLAPEPVSGMATVAAVTVNYQAWLPAQQVPYVIAIVELDDAPEVRLTTNIVQTPAESVTIGQHVRVVFEPRGEFWVPLFAPNDAPWAP
jgi:uncharacterized OB-fold protein